MKARLSNLLVPRFLRTFNDYLLRNHPVVWRTGALWILFYSPFAAVLLFGAGFWYAGYSVSEVVKLETLTVPPIDPIEMSYDRYYLVSVAFILIGVFYWAYRQYQLKFAFTKSKEVLITLGLYAVCFWVLFGLVAPAFRLGTIYKTAWHWINEEDLQALENSGIYPYGLMLLPEDMDSTGNIKTITPSDTFLQRRIQVFQRLCRIEDTLLKARYLNTTFLENWEIRHNIYINFLDKKNYQKREYLLVSSIISDVLKFGSTVRDLPDGSGWGLSLGDLSNRARFLELSYLSYPPNQLYLSNQRGTVATLYVLYRSDLLNMSYLRDLLNMNEFLFKKYKYVFTRYNFSKSIDSIYVQNEKHLFKRPAFPYAVEDSVRSVKHARQYLQEAIYLRHGQMLLSYLVIASVLLFCIPFFATRSIFYVFIFYFILEIILMSKVENQEDANQINAPVYLLLPALALGWLLVSLVLKKQLSGFRVATQGLFVGPALVLGNVLVYVLLTLDSSDLVENYELPYDLAFYGVQVIGVIGSLLLTKARTLPKQ